MKKLKIFQVITTEQHPVISKITKKILEISFSSPSDGLKIFRTAPRSSSPLFFADDADTRDPISGVSVSKYPLLIMYKYFREEIS